MDAIPTADFLKSLSVAQLANLIRKNWVSVNFAAKPYLEAMSDIHVVNDLKNVNFGAGDTAASVVLYFLVNAGTWRGEVAKAIKKELNRRIGK